MCKSFFNNLLGGGGGDMPNPSRATETRAESQARVKQTTDPVAATAAGGSFVPQDRRRGRLAGLGL